MSEIKGLNKRYRKAREKILGIESEIHEMLSYMLAVGTEVRLTKKLAEWYNKNGEECGVPYKKLDAIKKRPKGVIEDFTFNSGDFNIKVRFDLPDLDYLRVGFEDIE